MAVATIQLPDGRTATVEVPDGMAPEALQDQLESMYERGDFDSVQSQPMSYHDRLRNAVLPQSANMTTWDRFKQSADEAIPNPVSEFAAAANRGVTEFVDAVPNAVNAGLSLAGSNRRVPTLTGSLEKTGIQGGFMEPGAARDVVRASGSLVPAAGAMVPIARPAGAAASLAADFLGAGASKAAPALVDTAANALGVPQSVDNAVAAYRGRTPTPRPKRVPLETELALKRRNADVGTLGLKLDDAGRAFTDKAQSAATKQGVADSVVTMIRDASPQAKAKMRGMLDIVDGSKKNARFEALNRPGDIVGESITLRTRALASANRMAGKMIDREARALKGRSIDVSGAMSAFEQDLADMGISRVGTGTNFRFEASDIDGLEGATRTLNGLLEQLRKRDGTDAYVVHQMKRWIDEQVSWGKAGEGLSGKTERVLKSLRRNLDATLDQQFPEYNRANTMYSDTIQALDALQTAAGKRIDLTGKNAETALGTLSRRILGNVVSRQDLMKGLDEVDSVARRVLSGDYAGTGITPYRPDFVSNTARVSLDDLDDGLVEQIRFVSELESIFGTNAKNSFLGDVTKAVERGTESLAVGDKTGPIRAGIRMGIDKARGINEENAMKALRELLK